MRRKYLAQLLTACFLTLAGCSAAPQRPLVQLGRGAPIPAVRLADLSGNPRTLEEFKGRPFILTFWAPWCAMCLAEMPSFERLRSNFRDEPLEIVAVGVDSSREEVKRGTLTHDLPFTVLVDVEDGAKDAFGIDEVPITLVIDGQGRVVEFPDPVSGVPSKRITGPREWAGYETVRAIESLRSEQ